MPIRAALAPAAWVLAAWVLVACALTALALGPEPAQAQAFGPSKVAWSAQTRPAAVAPGGEAAVVLEARIDAGWKMYALDSPRPTRGVRVRFDALPEGFALDTVRQSPPQDAFDPNFEMDVRYFEEAATLTAVLAVEPSVAPGRYRLEGTVTYQVCDPTVCLPPRDEAFAVAVRVGAAGVAADEAGGGSASTPGDRPPARSPAGTPADETPGAAVPPLLDLPGAADPAAGSAAPEAGAPSSILDTADEFERAQASGLWGFLLLAVGAGLAALLTPCVFPMIPLTVSYFSKHAEAGRGSGALALVYGASIVLTFTALGVLAALFVGAAGAQAIAANPWVNLFIGVVFVVFALSLLGLFELRVPHGLVNYFNRESNSRAGYGGAVFMALTLTLVSFSCTAPFVGALLAATVRGEWTYPIYGMLAFSATFALPFVAFALFPRGLSTLPRSGAWMNTVKVVLGFVELAAAIKFLSNADLVWGLDLISRPLAIAASVVIFFFAGLYLIGKLPLAHEPAPETVGVVRMLLAVFFFGTSLYLLPGLFGSPLGALDAYLPPRQATDVGIVQAGARAASGGGLDFDWYEDVDAAFAEAAEVRKPVFIDFTGYTCTNCRAMEANVFPRPAVARRLERDFVLLRLYTDEQGYEAARQRFQFQLTGTTALPTYAVVDPGSRKLLTRHSGMASVETFADFLAEGADAYLESNLAVR